MRFTKSFKFQKNFKKLPLAFRRYSTLIVFYLYYISIWFYMYLQNFYCANIMIFFKLYIFRKNKECLFCWTNNSVSNIKCNIAVPEVGRMCQPHNTNGGMGFISCFLFTNLFNYLGRGLDSRNICTRWLF